MTWCFQVVAVIVKVRLSLTPNDHSQIRWRQGVVEIHVKAKQNDEQVAMVYFTMVRRHDSESPGILIEWFTQSSLLILLYDLDPVFDQAQLEAQLQAMLDSVKETVRNFGEPCAIDSTKRC